MSDLLRIALVAEGITDYCVLDAVVEHLLNGRSYDLTLLQPESSVAFSGAGAAGIFGGGWKGVCKWCCQSADTPFGFADDPLFRTYNVLILHLDADVGDDPNEKEWPEGLPCVIPCPPPTAKTDALRTIALKWLGEATLPDGTVFCTPSKSTEAWIMFLFFPQDREMKRLGWECHPNPAGRLPQQPKADRFAKTEANYKARAPEIRQRWPQIAGALTEAKRFETEFLALEVFERDEPSEVEA